MDQSNDPEKNKSLKYKKIARKLHKAFQNNSKRFITIKGSAFNTDFAKDDPASKAERKDRSCNWKRAETIIKKESSFFKKLKNPKCLACNIKGYVLPDCWTIFKSKRPEGFKPSEGITKIVKERLATDKGLAAKIEKLKFQEQDADEA